MRRPRSRPASTCSSQLGVLSAEQAVAVRERIVLVDAEHAPAALAEAELVFEGVPETMEAKRDAFDKLGRWCRDGRDPHLHDQQHPRDASSRSSCTGPSASSTSTGSTRPT